MKKARKEKMIDIKFIESAREIRKKYLILHEQLDNSKEDITNLADFLREKTEEFNDLNENVVKKTKSKEDVINVTKKLITKLDEIQQKEKSMTKKIDDISEEIEKLKAEEVELMNLIKQKYPNLSNQEIIKEVHSRLWA